MSLTPSNVPQLNQRTFHNQPPRRSNQQIDPVDVQVGQPTLDSFREYGDATMAEARRRLDPMMQEREARFRQDLVNRGISEGSQAYDSAFANFSRDRNDLYNSAQNQSLQSGLAAQQQAFGQNLAESQLANTLEQQRMNLAAQQASANSASASAAASAQMQRQNFLDQLAFNREQLTDDRSRWDQNFGRAGTQWDQQFGLQSGQADFGNMMSLLGFDFGANQYNNDMLNNDFQRSAGLFGLAPNQGPNQLDVMSPYQMQQNQQNQNYQSQMANRNGMFGALGQLGSSAMPFFLSDRDSKTELREFDTAQCLGVVNSIPLVEFTYTEEGVTPLIGTYAQDFNLALHGKSSPVIQLMDMLGVLIGSVKELSAKVERLEAA